MHYEFAEEAPAHRDEDSQEGAVAVDVVFMIDTSGSMADEIDAVKASCAAFAETIARRGVEVRLGLAGFDIGGHRGPSQPSYKVVRLGTYTIGLWPLASPEEFRTAVRSLSLGLFGGGGCYLANEDTVDIFPHVVGVFGSSVRRRRMLVIISDEIGSRAGLARIVSALKQASITAHVMGVPGKDGAHESLAAMTGGKFWDITRSKGRHDFEDVLAVVARAIADEVSAAWETAAATVQPVGSLAATGELAYRRKWESTHPGCLVVLVDQSTSMNKPFGGKQIGAGRQKADMVATVLNRVLDEFIRTNTVGIDVKPRAEVAILGYRDGSVYSLLSRGLGQRWFASLPELAANPLRIETRTQKSMDEEGRVYDEEVMFPVWVEPVARGDTPMCAAFRRARELVEGWSASHSQSFPPIVINITDGGASDGDPTRDVHALCQVKTGDGLAVLFNCHITNSPDKPTEFISSESDLPQDRWARGMFYLSSLIPESTRGAFRNATGQDLRAGTRAYIFNGDASSVRKMLQFGSTAAQVPSILGR